MKAIVGFGILFFGFTWLKASLANQGLDVERFAVPPLLKKPAASQNP